MSKIVCGPHGFAGRVILKINYLQILGKYKPFNAKFPLSFLLKHLSFLMIKGKPRPKVTWSKDGEPLNPTLVSLRTSEIDTILFIRKSERKHSGRYDLQVQIENVEDTAKVMLQIVGKQDWRHTAGCGY